MRQTIWEDKSSEKRGPPGAKGDPGVDGMSSIFTWFPKSMLHLYRQYEEMFCLCLRKLSHDVKMGEDHQSIFAWNSWVTTLEGENIFTSVGEQTGKLASLDAPLGESGNDHDKLNEVGNRRRYAIHFIQSAYLCKNVSIIPEYIEGLTQYVSIICVTFRTFSSSRESTDNGGNKKLKLDEIFLDVESKG